MNRMLKRPIIAGLAALCFGIPGLVQAEEAKEFTFDPLIITALRQEKNDLNTPAYVHVITGEKLKKTGADNLLDALKFVEGITYDGYGASGHLYSSMTAKATIRGMDRGTVVLVNGVPTNMSGYYALERIPLDNIEKVEVLKGAASVLYGSAAMGGVINIIAKDRVENSVSVEGGNFGRRSQAVSLQLGKLGISASHKEQGDLGQVSEPWSSSGTNRIYTAYRGDDRDSFRWTWVFDDKAKFTYQHDVDDFKFDRIRETGALNEKIFQKETKDYYSLQLKHGAWTSNLYGNTLTRDYQKNSSAGAITADTKHDFGNLGIDNQTSWKTGYGEYTAGMTWHKEWFEADDYLYPAGSASSSYVGKKERDFFSLFLQLNHPLAANRDLIIGARQEFIRQKEANDYDEFCPQLQLITRITPDTSWYVNVGRAFRMPNLSDMYGSTWRKTANPNLDPEYGYNYETGWKYIKDDYSLKLAIFHMDFTNYIQWQQYPANSGLYVPYNSKFRNTGIEVSYDRKLNDAWNYSLGASWGNPEQKSEQYGTTSDWQQAFPRWQVTGSVRYSLEKWSASLSASYTWDRMNDLKPCLPVNLLVGYQMTPEQSLQLRVENLLDRYDIVSHGSSHYLALERSYTLKYTHKLQ